MKRKEILITSLEEKKDIIQCWMNNRDRKVKEIAAAFNLPAGKVSQILNSKKVVMARLSKGDGIVKKRRRRARYEKIEEMLLEWLKRAKKYTLSINTLISQARVFACDLNLEFDESMRYLWAIGFENRHNITFSSDSREKSNDAAVAGSSQKNQEDSVEDESPRKNQEDSVEDESPRKNQEDSVEDESPRKNQEDSVEDESPRKNQENSVEDESSQNEDTDDGKDESSQNEDTDDGKDESPQKNPENAEDVEMCLGIHSPTKEEAVLAVGTLLNFAEKCDYQSDYLLCLQRIINTVDLVDK